VADLAPQRLAALLQPVVERVQGRERRHGLPEAVPRIMHVLLDLALLPAGRRVAELGFEQVVADHGLEARVDVALLAAPDLVDGGLHVVVDAAARDTAQHFEGVVVRIEQHLVGLQRIGSQQEGPAVAELEVRDLQLGAPATLKILFLAWIRGAALLCILWALPAMAQEALAVPVYAPWSTPPAC
jgi:hypothetical protein